MGRRRKSAPEPCPNVAKSVLEEAEPLGGARTEREQRQPAGTTTAIALRSTRGEGCGLGLGWRPCPANAGFLVGVRSWHPVMGGEHGRPGFHRFPGSSPLVPRFRCSGTRRGERPWSRTCLLSRDTMGTPLESPTREDYACAGPGASLPSRSVGPLPEIAACRRR